MKKGALFTILLALIFVAGLSLLLYPVVSDYWNSLHQSYAVTQYTEQVANLDNEIYDQLIAAARDYNKRLLERENQYLLTDEQTAEYMEQLNVTGNGVMSYIEIPAIGCSLPIRHGVDESVLQSAIGHLEWSSLPVGGMGTHTVLSGHRGLPSARLFTDLDRLVVGDTFIIRTLDETITYEVDQITVVLPAEVDTLQIDPWQDLCTLVTCTPYGVNTHRLLVRGHRIENAKQALRVRVTADATRIDPEMMTPLVAAPMLLALLMWLLFAPNKRKRRPLRTRESGT